MIHTAIPPPVDIIEEVKLEKKEIIEEASIIDLSAPIKLVSNFFKVRKTRMPVAAPTLGSFKPIVVESAVDPSTIVVDFPDELPTFPGGNKALGEYIQENFDINDRLLEYADKVKIVVEFIVNSDGQVTDIQIVTCSYPGLGAESSAKKLYAKMPKWIPGKNKGRITRVRVKQPITIRIH